MALASGKSSAILNLIIQCSPHDNIINIHPTHASRLQLAVLVCTGLTMAQPRHRANVNDGQLAQTTCMCLMRRSEASTRVETHEDVEKVPLQLFVPNTTTHHTTKTLC
jgi:hypothetical protein